MEVGRSKMCVLYIFQISAVLPFRKASWKKMVTVSTRILNCTTIYNNHVTLNMQVMAAKRNQLCHYRNNWHFKTNKILTYFLIWVNFDINWGECKPHTSLRKCILNENSLIVSWFFLFRYLKLSPVPRENAELTEAWWFNRNIILQRN